MGRRRDARDELTSDACECGVRISRRDLPGGYLTDPDEGRAVAEGVGEGATAVEMVEIGHFPMSEHPDLFNAYLREILADIRGDRDDPLPGVIAPDDVGVDFDLDAD